MYGKNLKNVRWTCREEVKRKKIIIIKFMMGKE